MKVAVPLAKNILAPLEITAAASSIDAGIQKKLHGSGITNLIISNDELNDIMKIVLKDSNILLKRVIKTIKNEKREQKGVKLRILSGTLGASSLGNVSAGKRMLRKGFGNKNGKGMLRAGYGNKMDF